MPEVNTQLAELNQAKLKPSEGFSPLRPFINFAEALGFKGPPDRYEAAKRSVEEKKAETAAAQASPPAEGGKPGDDILIQTTLSKDPSGKTQQSTVLGGNPNTPTAGTDKNTEKKKKDSGRNKKKDASKKSTDRTNP